MIEREPSAVFNCGAAMPALESYTVVVVLVVLLIFILRAAGRVYIIIKFLGTS